MSSKTTGQEQVTEQVTEKWVPRSSMISFLQLIFSSAVAKAEAAGPITLWIV